MLVSRCVKGFLLFSMVLIVGCGRNNGGGASGGGATGEKAEPRTDGTNFFTNLVADNLHDASGSAIDAAAALQDIPFVLVYFSAHWCPPCRQFTPKLVDYYNKNGGGNKFEILFIGSDRSRSDMLAYMKQSNMPWKGVEFQSEAHSKISKQWQGQGIPQLVLFDSDGNLLADSYKGRKYLGPYAALEELSKLLKDYKFIQEEQASAEKEQQEKQKQKAEKAKKKELAELSNKLSENPTSVSDKQLNELYKINALMKNKNGGQAIINGTFVKSGAKLADGVFVREIHSNHVIIDVNGVNRKLVQ